MLDEAARCHTDDNALRDKLRLCHVTGTPAHSAGGEPVRRSWRRLRVVKVIAAGSREHQRLLASGAIQKPSVCHRGRHAVPLIHIPHKAAATLLPSHSPETWCHSPLPPSAPPPQPPSALTIQHNSQPAVTGRAAHSLPCLSLRVATDAPQNSLPPLTNHTTGHPQQLPLLASPQSLVCTPAAPHPSHDAPPPCNQPSLSQVPTLVQSYAAPDHPGQQLQPRLLTCNSMCPPYHSRSSHQVMLPRSGMSCPNLLAPSSSVNVSNHPHGLPVRRSPASQTNLPALPHCAEAELQRSARVALLSAAPAIVQKSTPATSPCFTAVDVQHATRAGCAYGIDAVHLSRSAELQRWAPQHGHMQSSTLSDPAPAREACCQFGPRSPSVYRCALPHMGAVGEETLVSNSNGSGAAAAAVGSSQGASQRTLQLNHAETTAMGNVAHSSQQPTGCLGPLQSPTVPGGTVSVEATGTRAAAGTGAYVRVATGSQAASPCQQVPSVAPTDLDWSFMLSPGLAPASDDQGGNAVGCLPDLDGDMAFLESIGTDPFNLQKADERVWNDMLDQLVCSSADAQHMGASQVNGQSAT